MSAEVPCCMGMAARDNCTCDAGPVIARSEAVRRMVAAEAERDRLAGEVETLRARLAAAEALAEKWDASGCDGGPAVPCRCLSCASSDLRAVLEVTPDA